MCFNLSSAIRGMLVAETDSTIKFSPVQRQDRQFSGWRVENQSHLITFNACLNSDNRVRHFFDIGRRSGITKLLGQQNPNRNTIYMDHRIARQWRLGWDEISMRCKTKST